MLRGLSKKNKAPPEIDNALLEELFMTYADEDDPDLMSMDGIGKLCESLELDPSADVRVLVLLWRLGAVSKPGSLTKTEFVNGMKSLHLDSIAGLRNIVETLDPGFLDRREFRDFFKFVFQFSREGTHKTIEKDVVAALLPIALRPERAPHLSYFLEFLESSHHTRITLDQWDSFLQFQSSVDVDLHGYDEDGAWPLLLDEYVEWRKSGCPKPSGLK